MGDENEFHTFRGYELLRQEDRALLSPSQEDYLEMIYRHCVQHDYIRINTLAEQLHVAAPSVTRITKKLRELGFLKHRRYGYVTLTEAGQAAGAFLLDRHNTVQAYLSALGVLNRKFVDAELMEHCISDETLQAMKAWLKFLEANPDILERFQEGQKRSTL
ncbi:MAG: DtxR family transcriptional regulator [Firmicutes bacterium]|nr:DtxR family transcriptional regulator [Dethiobacter sp.]MBS3887989.1 DtxR family transcriptional regulator [Bacillota bacterium]MBS4055251.1 DtxR family transcriptional regulator [Thermaerobacter sp.]